MPTSSPLTKTGDETYKLCDKDQWSRGGLGDLSSDGMPVVLIDPGWVKTDMGGPEADIDPKTVAEGILDIATTLDISMSGRFYKWNGEARAF
ncbi:MAG: hypothetical protein V3V13_13510 [Paracoccaceae bacterium]